MKRLLMAMALISVLWTPAIAGLIPTVGVAPPPPPDEITSTSAPGEVPSVGLTEVSDAALNLIQMMLGAS